MDVHRKGVEITYPHTSNCGFDRLEMISPMQHCHWDMVGIEGGELGTRWERLL